LHADSQIGTLNGTPALRREEIKLQLLLVNSLMHAKGFGASETRAAINKARMLIERAEALGERAEDPLLLFSILYSLWAANLVSMNGNALLELAAHFLALAEKQGATGPLMIGHRLMATSLSVTGDLATGRNHYDRAIALYNPAEHRALASRFGQDVGVVILSLRSWTLWLLGYPEAAQQDAKQALASAREIGQATTLMYALWAVGWTHLQLGDYTKGKSVSDEVVALADQKGALFWKFLGMLHRADIQAASGEASEAIHLANSVVAAALSSGTTAWFPTHLSHLAKAHSDLGQFEYAWRYIGDAMTAVQTTDERLYEAEVNRVAGEIARASHGPDQAKAEAYFQRALSVARQQQAKSLELRAAMSLARLWRDQGKVQQARELLAPVYGWFTEGFDTRDLKEAKALLEELSA
jgi:predicted ATPase